VWTRISEEPSDFGGCGASEEICEEIVEA
jgi:hypothetical protein